VRQVVRQGFWVSRCVVGRWRCGGRICDRVFEAGDGKGLRGLIPLPK
jgi:hypothetical protein